MTSPGSVTITRARHALHGQTLRVLGRMRRHGRLELLLVLSDGTKSLIPADWTDLGGEDRSAEPVATLGKLEDLMRIVTICAHLAARGEGQEEAARQSPCKEDSRAAHSAQSDAGSGSGATPRSAGPAPRRGDRTGRSPVGGGGRQGQLSRADRRR